MLLLSERIDLPEVVGGHRPELGGVDRLGLVGDADVRVGVVLAQARDEVAACLRHRRGEVDETLHRLALRGTPKVVDVLDREHPAAEATEQAVELCGFLLFRVDVLRDPLRGVCSLPRLVHPRERVDVVPQRLPFLGRGHGAGELAVRPSHPSASMRGPNSASLAARPNVLLGDRPGDPGVRLVEAGSLRDELLHLRGGDARGCRFADERLQCTTE